MIADLFTLAGTVPLEQRKGTDNIMNKAKGMYYGVYNQGDLNASSYGNYKRESATAISTHKRKEL